MLTEGTSSSPRPKAGQWLDDVVETKWMERHRSFVIAAAAEVGTALTRAG